MIRESFVELEEQKEITKGKEVGRDFCVSRILGRMTYLE